MESANYSLLNRFFLRKSISDFMKNQNLPLYEECVSRYLMPHANDLTNLGVIEKLYDILNKQYRNEYFFKNTILNKLLLGVHSLNTSIALAEITINKSKPDFILVNGKGVVYEIKSDQDSLVRLETQIQDYFKAFCYVCVVTNDMNYSKVINIFKDWGVGVYVLTSHGSLSCRQEPEYNKKFLDKKTMFEILRKYEFENILKRTLNKLPEVNDFLYYDECYRLLSKMTHEKIHKEMIKELKKRDIKHKNLFKDVIPYELKYTSYFSDFKQDDYNIMKSFLQRQFGA